ncbi:E3 ubiquitin-protein ligase TRIM65 isoform X1 [Lepisosteus oculatus]|uniref:E3 ubiquitin-protein ligase TRIM65 isoform X1 n=2 Tax=Lepisosteus oculatus TaxID=7918 RepID=UPI003724B27D
MGFLRLPVTEMDHGNLSCAICLEPFKVPVTIPCGHNFCYNCISKHWERGNGICCPSCRMTFNEKPPLNKNVNLSDLLENHECAESALGNVCSKREVGTCRQHNKSLELYCRTDRMCICCQCAIQECKPHDIVLIQDERKKQEVTLSKKNQELVRYIEGTTKSIEELKDNIAKTKVFLQQTSEWVNVKFCQLLKSMTEKQEAVQQFMQQEMEVVLTEAEGRLTILEERAEKLRENQKQIETIHTLPDIHFLREAQFVALPGIRNVPLNVSSDLQDTLTGVTGILSKISKLLLEDLEKAISVASGQESQGSPEDKQIVVASIPDPIGSSCSPVREGFRANYRKLSFNPDTANANIWLSKDSRQAKHKTSDPQNYPPNKARFENVWQVLCTEGLSGGQHYWEVEITKPWAYIGVAYDSIPRKGKGKDLILGLNEFSWSLHLSEKELCAWHAGRKEPVQIRPHYRRIGLLLNCHAGTLTYYGEGQTILHTFYNAFSQELYPAFWIGEGVSVTLCMP